jgi:hypothetical protein
MLRGPKAHIWMDCPGCLLGQEIEGARVLSVAATAAATYDSEHSSGE